MSNILGVVPYLLLRLPRLCILGAGLLLCALLYAPANAAAPLSLSPPSPPSPPSPLSPPLSSSPPSPSLPNFEEDITLGLEEGQLRALGAKPCPEAALCLDMLWAGREWKATLRMQGGKLDAVELYPKSLIFSTAAKEQLEEFALAPVRVKAGDVQCDAFTLTRQGKSAEKAVALCVEKLNKVAAGVQCSVWYVDEDAVEELLRAESLESAGSSHARTVAARLSIAPGVMEVGYGHLGSLLQPSLKP